MQSLAETLQGLGQQSSPVLEDRRQQALGAVERFFLPRLEERGLPLIVALIGSTGAGKSTILNSLAGKPISRVGVVRPTTRDPIVWCAARHAEQLDWMGAVMTDDHPLTSSVALVDTPDLDSDLAEHGQRALLIADASDAIVMVTTAARYGDARPWEALANLPDRPLIVVLNRVATRSSGARNFLATQLRDLSYEDAVIVTISEQKTDRVADKLPHQSVRKLTQLLTVWTQRPGMIRAVTFDRLADRTAADVDALLAELRTRRLEHRSLAEIADDHHRQVAGELAAHLQPTRRRRWRRIVTTEAVGSIPMLQEALDRAAAASYVAAGERGIDLPASMRSAAPTAQKGIKGWAVLPADLTNLEGILTTAGSAWAAMIPTPSDEQVDQLTMGLEMLTDLEWPGD
jgi:energy-coupling factor transporter ATP-binding protein EcfA2